MTTGRYLEGIKEDIQFIKESIKESFDSTIRVKAEDIRNRMGPEFEKDSLVDIYYGLRSELFDEGLVVGRGEHKDGDMLLTFRNIYEKDNRPKTRKEEEKEEVETYHEIDKDVPGLSGIAMTGEFNEYDPERIVDVIMKHKDVISRVRSIGDDTVEIVFASRISTEKLIAAMVDLKSLGYDEIDQNGLAVLLWWA